MSTPGVRVRDVMDQKAARLRRDATFRQAAELLVLTDASDLIVIDGDGRFEGVLSEGDLLRALLPDHDEIRAAGGTLASAIGLFVANGRHLAEQTIARLVIAQPIVVAPDAELLEVAAVMLERMIRRLPVVEAGRFLGTISRADVAWAVLARHADAG
jgi:CBS domain-containing protein